ncbi:UNVERIFIED_CONTAM: hypothetical protein FKN15_069040 [Acipenser sinensis]
MADDYRKLRDWILENAGLEAQSIPVAVRFLQLMDSERWEAYAREQTRGRAAPVPYKRGRREEPQRPQPEREEPERPQPKREEPERPTPEWEEPERPTPEWEEPERPTPEWEEPERPQPKRGESVRPQPKREESVRPQPKREEVGASTALDPKLPAEREYLLVHLLLPSQEPEGEELQAQPPEFFWGEKGRMLVSPSSLYLCC